MRQTVHEDWSVASECTMFLKFRSAAWNTPSSNMRVCVVRGHMGSCIIAVKDPHSGVLSGNLIICLSPYGIYFLKQFMTKHVNFGFARIWSTLTLCLWNDSCLSHAVGMYNKKTTRIDIENSRYRSTYRYPPMLSCIKITMVRNSVLYFPCKFVQKAYVKRSIMFYFMKVYIIRTFFNIFSCLDIIFDSKSLAML